MIINTEFDFLKRELFLNVEDSGNNVDEMESSISEYIGCRIKPEYKIYLFLCDETWALNSKQVVYKKLWKQEYNKGHFFRYSENKEQIFYNNAKDKVMFATFFELFHEDLCSAIKINAEQFVKHSFIFLSKEEPKFTITDIFLSLGITDEIYLGNNWIELIDFAKKNEIIVVQKWQGGNGLSLRFFLFDDEIPIS